MLIKSEVLRDGYIGGLMEAKRVILEALEESQIGSDGIMRFGVSEDEIQRLVETLREIGVNSAQYVTKSGRIIGFAVTSKRGNIHMYRVDYDPETFPHHEKYDGIYKGAMIVFYKDEDGEMRPNMLSIKSEKTAKTDSKNPTYYISKLG